MIDLTRVTRERNIARWLLTGAFIVWLIFILSSYFVVNKPIVPGLIGGADSPFVAISGATVGAVARALMDLGAAVWITLVALGIGVYLWEWLIGASDDVTLIVVFSTGLGFGVLGLLILGLGLAGFVSRPISIAILALFTLLTASRSVRLLRQLQWKRPPLLTSLYLSLVLGMTLTLALLPPTSWDGLFYHLTGPKLYLQAGSIGPGIDLPHLNFPALSEMLFLLGMALRSDITAKLLHLAYLLLLGGTVYLVTTRLLEVRNGWLSLLFLSATPLVPVIAAWAYNDLALTFYGLSALFAIIQWRDSRQTRWLALAGIFSGFMMGMKYTSIVPALFFVAVIFWHCRGNLRRSVRPLLFFMAPSVALVTPWLLKNWLFTGNPVYPFLFGGRFWDAFRAAQYSETGTGIGLNLLRILRLPYDMTLGYADASQEATIGPLYLSFLPLILWYTFTKLRRDAPPAFGILLSYVLLAALFWTAGVVSSAALWQARLLLPGIVALCPILAWMLEDLSRFDHPVFSLQRFLKLVVIFVIVLLFLSQFSTWLRINPLAYLSGAETRTAYLQRILGAPFATMSELGSHVDEQATVLFLWEPRSYYCSVECRPDSILDRFEHLHYLHGNAQGIANSLQDGGITHILIFEAGLEFILNQSGDPLTTEEAHALRELREQHLTLLYNWNGAYSLYRLEK